jgi:hypothetical protein
MTPYQRFKTTFVRFYPPLWFAGIRVKSKRVENILSFHIKLKSTLLNRGVRGTYFGGSAFSMVDPFHMLILMDYLGNDYLVWDKKSSIKFIKPSRKALSADVILTKDEMDEIRQKVDSEGDSTPSFKIQIHDTDGILVAEVEKVVYLRKITNEKS